MTKVVERIAETVIYEYDDYGDDKDDVEEGNYNASEEEEEEEEEEEDLMTIEQIETKYEKYRDDQMNTGVIAALVGGFALTNSWEMNIDGSDTENLSNVELGSYTLAILAVHGCTCSALVSAFLYRSITRVKSPKASVAWVERHPILVQLPWYKFLFGTACYLVSVMLVAWTTLQFNIVSRLITLVGGISGCSIIVYTCYIMYVDACVECKDHEREHEREGKNDKDRRRRRRRCASASAGTDGSTRSISGGSSSSIKKIPNSVKNKDKYKNTNIISRHIQH